MSAPLWPGMAERLAARTTPDPVTGCLLWTGTINHEGYGKVWVPALKLRRFAHRIAYELAYGPIPGGRQLDHLCRVRPCINPEHLEAVTPRVNALRSESIAAKNAVKTHCDRGHELAGDNVRTKSNGGRQCWTCQQARSREHYERNREAIKAKTAARKRRTAAEAQP